MTPTPSIKAVPNERTGEKEEPETVQIPKPLFWVFTLSSAFTLALVALVVILADQIHRQRTDFAGQYQALSAAIEKVKGDTDEIKTELQTLRHVIGSKTAEDIIFLKALILNSELDPALARKIAKSIHVNAQLFKRDPDFILAVIDVESNFNPEAVSSAGAVGLMQVMPQWKEQLGITEDLTDLNTSIRYGLQIFNFYDQMYADVETSLMAYNRGPGKVDLDLMTGRDPTRNGYAAKILQVWERLKAMNIEIPSP